MGRGPFAKMKDFEYKDDDPVTISKETREAMKNNKLYNLKKIQKNSLYGIMITKQFGWGKTHAVMMKEQNDEKATDERRSSESYSDSLRSLNARNE